MTPTQFRPLVLIVTATLVAAGLLPTDVKEFIDAHAEALLSAVLTLWSMIAFFRNRKARKAP